MKTISFFLLSFFITAINLGFANADQSSTEPERSDTEIADLLKVFDQANADHIILVGFKDNTLDRIPSKATSYRKRGEYQSSTWSQRVSDQIAEDYHLQKLSEWPMTAVDVHCVVYQVPMTLSVADTRESLTHDERIEIVQNLNVFSTKAISKSDRTDELNVDPYSGLQSNLLDMQIDQVHTKTTGKNISIAMIDTGVDTKHPDLEGQISQNKNFAEAYSKGFINDKHGTAVAGVMIAKKDNGTGIVGVAPDANLIALKACWPDKEGSMAAKCNSFTLALAVNNAINSGAKILNMSLTGPYDPILALLLKKAISEGQIVVASDSGQGTKENFPASLDKVISVRSIASGLTAANEAEPIAAPGEKVLTTQPHGTYDFISGSSIAAAEVSGVVALLLEIRPNLNSDEVISVLRRSLRTSHAGMFSGISAKYAILAMCEKNKCPRELVNFASRAVDPIELKRALKIASR